MEKLILDYTYADISPQWEGLREEFLREKDDLPFVRTLREDWLPLIRSRLEGFSAKHLVVVGIGGSSLGAEAVLRALLPVSFNSRGTRKGQRNFQNWLNPKIPPSLLFPSQETLQKHYPISSSSIGSSRGRSATWS